ncbi:MAG: cysteine desulfurase family protein [Planctomycetota bacterium]|nr:cysteine desulfurase family protein [Planctomycetota bacterium]
MRAIYLDHNSTTPLLPAVAEAMQQCQAANMANPASQHAAGRRARQALEDAREGIAEILGAKTVGQQADRLIFTSGGTEANNLALFGLAGQASGTIYVSGIEHPSVLAPVERLAQLGWQVQELPANSDGVVSLDGLESGGLPNSPEPLLMALMLGNNETGVLQPVQQAAAICRKAFANRHSAVHLHTDAVQAVGKIPVDFQALGCSTLAFTAHKFHGPRGIGGLMVRHDVQLHPQMFGGFQQAGLRPGTEPVALAVGMHAALLLWQQKQVARRQHLTMLRDRFETQILAELPKVVVNGQGAERLPHTSNLAFVGLDRRALVMALDMQGVACSTGSACASGSSEPSSVLLAMQLPVEIVASSLRFSFGATTTTEDLDEAVRRIVAVCRQQ